MFWGEWGIKFDLKKSLSRSNKVFLPILVKLVLFHPKTFCQQIKTNKTQNSDFIFKKGAKILG